jgi:Cu-Zn family superoxide dismutase
MNFIEIINKAFLNYNERSNINDFLEFTTASFKLPNFFDTLPINRIHYFTETIWISQCDCYARIDIQFQNDPNPDPLIYRIFLIRTYDNGNKGYWRIDQITEYKEGIQPISKAICVLTGDIKGTVEFIQQIEHVEIIIQAEGLTPGHHGIHIHEYGDLTEHCVSVCNHFNPTLQFHGGIADIERHTGDLGNIIADKNGRVNMTINDNRISLQYNNPHCIIGRSVVIHQEYDDSRKEFHIDSHTTGHAGKRIACGVIGIKR